MPRSERYVEVYFVTFDVAPAVSGDETRGPVLRVAAPGRHLDMGGSSAPGDATLAALLEASEVAVHPFVVGELARGSLRSGAVRRQRQIYKK